MADISQDIYDKGRRIRKILYQQNRGLGDYELNELQDMWLEFQRDVQRIAGSIGPVGDGFEVVDNGVSNQLLVRKGVFQSVCGTLLFLEEDTVISGLSTPGGVREDWVFVILSEDEKNETTWPDIVNPSTGSVQALRLAVDLRFAVWEDITVPGNRPSTTVNEVGIQLAQLNRTANPIIAPAEITDTRWQGSSTYHIPAYKATGRVEDAGGLLVDVEAATGKLAGTDFSVGADVGLAMTDNSENYIYIAGSPIARTVSVTRPIFCAAFEAKVTTSGGTIDSIEDMRWFRSRDQDAIRLEDLESSTGALNLEVVQARGSRASLDDRLDESLNEDGTLKPDAAFGGSIEFDEMSPLRPGEQAVPDMTVYVEAGQCNYGTEHIEYAGGSSPTFTAPSSNDRVDLLYIDSAGALQISQGVESVTPSSPSHSGKLPIAEVYLTTTTSTITDSEITDVRPFLNLGGGTGGGDVYTRLLDHIEGTVYERHVLDALLDTTDLGGSSNGTLVEPSNYELAAGEILETAFLSAPDGAPTSISQVGVVIYTQQSDTLSSSSLLVEVDRGAGYEVVTTFTGESGNHTFTGGISNVLNLKITNNSGGTVNVEGYALSFLNSGGASGYFEGRSGIHLDGSGFQVFNTNVAAFRASAADFAFTWDAANDRLSWGPNVGVGDDLQLEVTDSSSGTVTQTLPLAGSPLNGIVAGSYVYFDMDRVSASVTPQVSVAGPPSMDVADRFILGRRIPDPNGGNDQFVLFNNHLLKDITSSPEVVGGVGYPPTLLTSGVLKYINLASHGVWALNQIQLVAGSSTYTYTIAGFAGTGLNTSKIRGLWVEAWTSSNADLTDVAAHWPDGVLHTLAECDSVAVGDDRHQKTTLLVPIQEGQVSLDFQLRRIGGVGSAGASYTIIGAWQVG